jgi:hypothetical protein
MVMLWGEPSLPRMTVVSIHTSDNFVTPMLASTHIFPWLCLLMLDFPSWLKSVGLEMNTYSSPLCIRMNQNYLHIQETFPNHTR